MDVSLLDFVQECRQLAKQALGKRAGEPASGGFARWKHVVLHCIRIEDDHSYRELVDRIALMETVCDELDLDPDDLPKLSTLCKSFDRFEMWVWRPRRNRRDVLRANTALVPLPPAVWTGDTDVESDGLGRFTYQDCPRQTALGKMEA